MINKINNLLNGRTFEELVTIYEGFTDKEFNLAIESAIIDKMIEVDEDKFIEWELMQ